MNDKLCDMTCIDCAFSLMTPAQTSRSLSRNQKLVFDIDVFEKNYLMKLTRDIPNKIILKKVSNKLIDFGIFKINEIERIIYHIDFNDLLIKEKLNDIKLNIDLILISGIFLRIYVFVRNKSDFIETMEILKEYKDISINFYCDKYFNFSNYKEFHFHAIDKVKIADLFDKNKCTHRIIKDFDIIYDYKQ